MEFTTFEARLATFEKPSKRSKLGWPHKTPTPEELAKAGFYYKPSSSSNDNTICFLCERALGGWETDDDPVDEHYKHSSECGWAILMNASKDRSLDIEDPTGEHLVDARRATFAIGWPHETKRGWMCKIDKMVEAGWHYAPTPESDDFVSCAYCKLSLDGWEPKDNPFDEHYRRSSECPFFHFAGTTAPSKRPKAKKGRASRAGRTSKASTRVSARLSTQSNTVLSEAPSLDDIPDLDDSIDTSTTSVLSVLSTASATTKGKRKGRAKPAQSKRAKTTRATKAKKQTESESIADAEPPVDADDDKTPTPAEVVEILQTPPPARTALPSPPDDASFPDISHVPQIPAMITRLSPLRLNSPTPVKSQAASAVRSTTSRTTRSRHARQSNPTSPSPASDLENAPPSTRSLPARQQEPLPLATTAAASPADRPMPTWTASDVELILQPHTPQPVDLFALTGGALSAEEKEMTVQQWIGHIASQAEAGLRAEAERVVSVFEREGQRAMGVLEEITCV